MAIVRIKTHKPSPFRLHTTDRHLAAVDTQRIAHASWIAPRDAALMAWISTKASEIFANHHMVAPSEAVRILPLPPHLDVAADATATMDDHEVVIDGVSRRISMIAHEHQPLDVDRHGLLTNRPLDHVVESPTTSLLVGVLESILPLMEDGRRLEPGILETINAPILDHAHDMNQHTITLVLNLGAWLLVRA